MRDVWIETAIVDEYHQHPTKLRPVRDVWIETFIRGWVVSKVGVVTSREGRMD